MSQIGIPKYRDLLNKIELNKLKDLLNIICIDYANLTSNESVENRESDSYETYTKQYSVDMIKLKDMGLRSQELINEINNILFIISTRSIPAKIYEE